MTSHTDTLDSQKGVSLIWSPGATLLWSFIIICVFVFAQFAGLFAGASLNGVTQALMDVMSTGDEQQLNELTYQKDLIWPMGLGGAIGGIIAVIVAVRWKRGLSVKDYLNLQNSTLPIWGLWLGIMILVAILIEVLSANFEDFQTPFMEDVVRNSKNLPMLFVSVGILAPIFEELFFRGFVFKGLERSFIGGHGAVWLIAVVFALIHTQYPWGVKLLIIPMGVVLGYSRMFSGSLMVPIVLHVLNNCMAIYYVLQSMDVETSF